MLSEITQTSFASSLMALVFLPGIASASEVLFRYLVYTNAFVFVSFYLVSGVCTIKKLASANDLDESKTSSRSKSASHIDALDLPFVYIIMPCHNEPDDSLLDSVRAVLDVGYSADRVHFFLAFDGQENKSSFDFIAKELRARIAESSCQTATAVVNGMQVTMSVFEHGGKLCCQSNALGLVKDCLVQSRVDPDQNFLLLVDSDTRVAANSLQVFAQLTVSPRLLEAFDGLRRD
jgi:cellulose synthase/poly-beta-1,6-N-acetylglucosamine synthase-like glycosyltransferase